MGLPYSCELALINQCFIDSIVAVNPLFEKCTQKLFGKFQDELTVMMEDCSMGKIHEQNSLREFEFIIKK